MLTLFLTLFLVFGSGFNTAGVFFDPLLHHFGWSRARLSSLQTVLGLSAGVTAPVFGWLLDFIDARFMISFGAALAAAGFFLASQAGSFLVMAIAYVMLGLGLAAGTLLPCSQVAANWFGGRRGVALGIAMAGTSIGGMVMVLVAQQAIVWAGWRAGYVTLALPMIVILMPLALRIVRSTPPEGAAAAEALPQIDLRRAISSRAFWMIAIAQLCFSFAITGESLHLIPYLVGIGYGPDIAALVLSFTLGLASAGKPSLGALADRWSGRSALALALAAASAGQLGLLGAAHGSMLVVAATVWGFASGAPLALIPAAIAQALGIERFGTIVGLTGVFTTLGAASGPLVAGWLYDSSHSYVTAFVLFAIVLLIGAAAALACVPPRPAASPPLSA